MSEKRIMPEEPKMPEVPGEHKSGRWTAVARWVPGRGSALLPAQASQWSQVVLLLPHRRNG